MKNTIRNTLIGAIASGMLYLSATGIIMPRMIEKKLNSPEAIVQYENAITKEAIKGIEEKVSNPTVREQAKVKTKTLINKIIKNGELNACIRDAPPVYHPKRFNPENYTFSLEYKRDNVARFGIQEQNKQYGVKPGSLIVNKDSILIRELTDTAKSAAIRGYIANIAPYAGGALMLVLAGFGLRAMKKR